MKDLEELENACEKLCKEIEELGKEIQEFKPEKNLIKVPNNIKFEWFAGILCINNATKCLYFSKHIGDWFVNSADEFNVVKNAYLKKVDRHDIKAGDLFVGVYSNELIESHLKYFNMYPIALDDGAINYVHWDHDGIKEGDSSFKIYYKVVLK